MAVRNACLMVKVCIFIYTIFIMGKKTRKKAVAGNDITLNRKAKHDFFIEETIEAGLCLQGWEAKSLRSGHAQLKESYIAIKSDEAWLLGAHFSPLPNTGKYLHPDPTRTRKLLLHRREIDKLTGYIKQEGYTLVPLRLHWRRGVAKCDIGLAKGKKQHDKRQSEKDRDWDRDKQRLLRQNQ